VEFGGFELAMLAGAMLEVARHRCIVVVDGFRGERRGPARNRNGRARPRALCLQPLLGENGHRKLLEHLQAQPLLDLRLRLGEGSGAALAWPLIESAARLMTEMASFESAASPTGSRMTEIRLLLTAVQYFTRIRVPAWVGHAPERLTGAFDISRDRLDRRRERRSRDVARGARAAGAAAGDSQHRVTLLMTGAIHEDGLADTCRRTRRRRDARTRARDHEGSAHRRVRRDRADPDAVAEDRDAEPDAVVDSDGCARCAHAFSRFCAVLVIFAGRYVGSAIDRAQRRSWSE
jgi:hypothetical protein